MKLNKYLVYVDDGRDVLKIAIPATSVSAARKAVAGSGDVIAVKDASEYLHGENARDFLQRTLIRNGYGVVEQNLILRALDAVGLFGEV